MMTMGASASNQNLAERVTDPGTGAAILIADDDPAIRLVVRHRLEADGHRVEEAVDSSAALAALRSNRFDVALLDIIMPGTGGLDVLSAALAADRHAGIHHQLLQRVQLLGQIAGLEAWKHQNKFISAHARHVIVLAAVLL